MIVLGLVVLLLGKKSRGATFPRVDPCLKDTKFFLMGFITDCLGVARERLQNRAFHQNDPLFLRGNDVKRV